MYAGLDLFEGKEFTFELFSLNCEMIQEVYTEGYIILIFRKIPIILAHSKHLNLKTFIQHYLFAIIT